MEKRYLLSKRVQDQQTYSVVVDNLRHIRLPHSHLIYNSNRISVHVSNKLDIPRLFAQFKVKLEILKVKEKKFISCFFNFKLGTVLESSI